jgi:hypothetical protein
MLRFLGMHIARSSPLSVDSWQTGTALGNSLYIVKTCN